jgi:hypothetical protein
MAPRKLAEQTYTFAEVCRLLHLPAKRARELELRGELAGADVVVPGGGRKAERWTASRVGEILCNWAAVARR